jgi:hypothetical protein
MKIDAVYGRSVSCELEREREREAPNNFGLRREKLNIKWICFGLVCKNYKKSLSSLMQVYLSIFGYILTKSVV